MVTAEKRDIDSVIHVIGDVAPDSELDVRAEVGGKIKKLYVEPGDTVKAGDPLLEIDDRDLQTNRKSAQTEIEGAKLAVEKIERNYLRSKELFHSKLVSREIYDNISADYRLAQNTLAKSQAKLQAVEDKLFKTKVFAPGEGTVLEVNVIEGQVVTGAGSVNAGTSIMKIADMSQLLVNGLVNQIDVIHTKPGKQVTITSDALGDEKIPATITFVAPIASMKNGVKGFEFEASLKVSSDSLLRPGMTVTLTIPVASVQDVVSVPVSAVFKDEDDVRVVYVRNRDGTEKREVKVGVSNYEYAEIKSGVQAGEEVLLVDPATLDSKS
jgi:RND family efflux transporter MFP subunit